jgi:predicted ATP-dependent serine protease
LERRLNEAAKLGFKRCLLPTTSKPGVPHGMELITVASVREALKIIPAKAKQLPSEQ